MKCKDYIIVAESGSDPFELIRKLNKQVCQKLEEGYEPLNGVSISNIELSISHKLIAYQTLIERK